MLSNISDFFLKKTEIFIYGKRIKSELPRNKEYIFILDYTVFKQKLVIVIYNVYFSRSIKLFTLAQSPAITGENSILKTDIHIKIFTMKV